MHLTPPHTHTTPTQPDNSVAAGEALIEEVYTALKASPYWDDALFLITYDEHGGFADHAPVSGV
jgi:phospholipase C